MFLLSQQKNECCGCTACQQVCPTQCLKMVPDSEGFLYPRKMEENKCIKCGLCERVCPFNKEKPMIVDEPACFYGWHKNNEIRKSSTSGAAFIATCELCRDNGYSYFSGAIYDDKNRVVHIVTDNFTDIERMKRSKYVQSTLGDTFKIIQEKVNAGHKVLFIGTPCQAEGIQRLIGYRNRDRLLTVGLVCHGVSSPLCFRKYIEELEERKKRKVQEIRFRDKVVLKGRLTHKVTSIYFKDGTCIKSEENPYTLAYKFGLMHRPSCSQCPFSTPFRDIDVTIGDFWGIEKYCPELTNDISKGISLVLAHTQKGKMLTSELDKKMHIVHMESYKYAICNRQQQLIKPYKINAKRDNFIDSVIKGKSIINMGNMFIIKRKIIDILSLLKKHILIW